MKLTDKSVKAVKAIARRQQHADGLCPGLYLVVHPTGKKSWTVRYRANGVQRRMTLGQYPAMTLSAARKDARDKLGEVAAGGDPAGETKGAADLDDKTVAAVLDDYANRKLTQLKSGDLVKRELDRFARKAWGRRDIDSIARKDVQALIDKIADSGRGPTANRVLAYVKAFFSWAVDRGIIDDTPAAKVKKAVKEEARDRVLTDDEICWFWQACDKVGYPWGKMGQVLLLTGQRLNEIAKLTRDEVEGGWIRLSKYRTKNGRPHALPLSPWATDILDALPYFAGKPGYLFTTTGHSPVSGFDKAKQYIADEMAKIAEHEIPHWTFHDLRRTCATRLAPITTRAQLEAVLNHAPPRMVGVYNHHDYIAEKRQAMEFWALRLRGIMGHDEYGNPLLNNN